MIDADQMCRPLTKRRALFSICDTRASEPTFKTFVPQCKTEDFTGNLAYSITAHSGDAGHRRDVIEFARLAAVDFIQHCVNAAGLEPGFVA